MFLVTGANGQLGQEFKKIYKNEKVIFVSKSELDITNENKLSEFFANNQIELVINCAAYTDVEQAENNIDICEQVNVIAIKNLAKLSKKYNFLIVHFSTDYVFDGTNYLPYKETDQPNPISIYGKSKLKGEEVLLDNADKVIIIRSSWIYSEFNKSFLKTMLNLADNKKELNVIYDQIGTPTYAYDLAKAVFEILAKIDIKNYYKKEIYNYSNEGIASWYDFAYEIIKIANKSCIIKPIKAENYKTIAKRPYYSLLDKEKIKKDFDIKIRHWKEGLIECLQKLI